MEKRIAIDTETQNGKAFVITHAKDAILIKSRWQMFHELRKLGRVFVFFNMDYDVSALLRWFKAKDWRKLYVEKSVHAEGYTMRYFPNKMWRVSCSSGFMEFFDLFSFFQCSLDKAAKICGIKKRKVKLPDGAIENFKDFWEANPKLAKRYAIRDSEILQEICDKMQIAMENIGLGKAAWYSPGYVAKRYFQAKGIRFGKLSKVHESFCKDGYFGARIEVARRGFFKSAHSYDIKSAYPFGMSQLPDFANARMWFSKKRETRYCVARCRVWMDKAKFYPFPVRHDNTIFFPQFQGETTFLTQDEIDNFRLGKIKFEKVLNIECNESARPYENFVRELYGLRKMGGMEGLLYKLILNSAYGISAETHGDYRHVSDLCGLRYVENQRNINQFHTFLALQSRLCPHVKRFWEKMCDCVICKDTRRIMRGKMRQFRDVAELNGELYRRSEVNGKMRNVLVAMNITAKTRMRAYQAMIQNEDKIVSVQTDGIFSTCELELENMGSDLGNWEYQGSADLLIIGSGVYKFGQKQKLRGFHYGGNLREVVRKAKTGVGCIPVRNRLTMGKLTLSRGHADHTDLDMNELLDDYKKLDLNFDRKRIWDWRVKRGSELLRSQIDSSAYDFEKLLAL